MAWLKGTKAGLSEEAETSVTLFSTSTYDAFMTGIETLDRPDIQVVVRSEHSLAFIECEHLLARRGKPLWDNGAADGMGSRWVAAAHSGIGWRQDTGR